MIKKLKIEQNKILQKAYDEGYADAKKKYKPDDTYWIMITGRQFVQYKCKKCGEETIADYPFCPYCGSTVRGKEE